MGLHGNKQVTSFEDLKEAFELGYHIKDLSGRRLYPDFVEEENKPDLVEEESKPDMVNTPKHYVGEQGLEVETVLQNFVPRYEDSYVAHRVASALEYLLRAPLKNRKEDMKKARKNIDQALEYLEDDNL